MTELDELISEILVFTYSQWPNIKAAADSQYATCWIYKNNRAVLCGLCGSSIVYKFDVLKNNKGCRLILFPYCRQCGAEIHVT